MLPNITILNFNNFPALLIVNLLNVNYFYNEHDFLYILKLSEIFILVQVQIWLYFRQNFEWNLRTIYYNTKTYKFYLFKCASKFPYIIIILLFLNDTKVIKLK